MKFPLVKMKPFPLSRKKYWLINIAMWLYTGVWIFSLVFVYYFWEAPTWIKLLIYLVLILGTPSLSDLIKSYKKYKMDWELEEQASRDIIRSGLGASGMVSKTGTVITECNPEGRIRIGNETWSALSAGKGGIDIGNRVIVRDIKGMTLIVEKESLVSNE